MRVRGWTTALLAACVAMAAATVRAQPAPAPEQSPLPTEAEIVAAISVEEAAIDAAARTGDPASRALFERRLQLARNLAEGGRMAQAERQLAAIRAVAPDDADGRGRLARAEQLALIARIAGGDIPADMPTAIARLAAPCGDGDSQAEDALRLGQGFDRLALLWRNAPDADRLAILDAAVACLQPVTGDGFDAIVGKFDLARLRLAAERPDGDYRAMLGGLEQHATFLGRSDDFGYSAELGFRPPATSTEPAALWLDTLWRVTAGERAGATPGRRIAFRGTYGSESPLWVAASVYETSASAALRRRAARSAAMYRRDARALALINEQADAIAAHRLEVLQRAARIEALGHDPGLATLISGGTPDRVMAITRELGDAANPMQVRGYGLPNLPDVMRAREGILLVVPTVRGTHIFLLRLTEGNLWAHSSLTQDDLAGLAREIRFHMGVDVGTTPTEFGRWSERNVALDAQHRLYRELVAPFAAEIAALDHLVVIAPGPLEGVPFSLLLTEEATGNSFDPAVLRSARWLADVVPMSRMPTLQAFALMRLEERDRRFFPESAGPRSRGFLGIADPLLAGPEVPCGAEVLRGGALTRAMPRDFAPSASLADSLRSLPRLPCTAPEAMAVARATPGRRTLLTGRASAEARFHAAVPRNAAVMMFATHAVMPGELPGVLEPSLVMTPPAASPPALPAASPAGELVAGFVDDGLISATEIARLAISPEWLILSACNTGSGIAGLGQHSNGGITPWFFAAGATRILATNWPLLDSAAADITTRAMRNAAREGVGGARALQQAMIAVRNDVSRDATPGASLAHPMVWAAFELHGDGSARPSGRD